MDIKISSSWFVLQVITGREKKIASLLSKLNLNYLKPYLPQKKLKIKKQGQIKEVISPLYPGYIFIIGNWDINEAKTIIKNPGIVKFVGGMISPGVLRKEEKELILNITSDGLAGYSKAVKIGSKIHIVSGPLKQLEGCIESVDRRKQRVIVKLPLLNSSIKVSLGFDYIELKDEN